MLSFFLKKISFEYTIAKIDFAIQGISFYLKTSAVSNAFVALILFMYLMTTIYSIGYMNFEKDKHKVRFHIFTFLSVLSCVGLAYSGNLITAFIFYDLLSVFTYMLVRHHGDENSERHAFAYAMYLILPSTLFLLPAIICVYFLVNHTNFLVGGILSPLPISKTYINLLFFLFMYGISKTALYPLHKWLIHAMVAPSPVSALLHAVLVVKGGLFFLYKVIYETFGLQFLQENIYTFYGIYWPIYIACFGIVVAAISAMGSKNIKQRLAYSTISQIGYISMCLFCFTEEGIIGAKMHFLSHSLAKILLFYYAGYLLARYHCYNVDELKLRRNHFNIFLSIMFIIPCLSLMSFPLTFGCIAKSMILKTTITSSAGFLIIPTIFIGTISCVIYLFPIVNHLVKFNNNRRFSGQPFSTATIYIPSFIISFLIVVLFFCK